MFICIERLCNFYQRKIWEFHYENSEHFGTNSAYCEHIFFSVYVLYIKEGCVYIQVMQFGIRGSGSNSRR